MLTEDIFRFDFSHQSKVTDKELNDVEELVKSLIKDEIQCIEDRQANYHDAINAGAIGLFSEIDFQKRGDNFTHLLTPKLLLKLSPGNMRKEDGGGRLSPINAFNFFLHIRFVKILVGLTLPLLLVVNSPPCVVARVASISLSSTKS